METIAEFHPFIVHFPLACLTLYTIVELFALILKSEKLKFSANLMLIIGVVSGIAAVLSGNQAAQSFIASDHSHVISGAEQILEQHEYFATILLWYFFFLLVLRTVWILKKSFSHGKHTFIVVFALVGLYIIIMTGYYGGKLVLDFGIGTKLLN